MSARCNQYRVIFRANFVKILGVNFAIRHKFHAQNNLREFLADKFRRVINFHGVLELHNLPRRALKWARQILWRRQSLRGKRRIFQNKFQGVRNFSLPQKF